MTTFSASTTAANDGYFSTSSWFSTGNDFVAGYSGGAFGLVCRFTNVTIPAGATISAATMTIRDTFGGGTPDIRVYLEAADNPAMPTTRTDAVGRTVTSNYCTYATAFTTGQNRTTPDNSPAVQEVINRGGWASGQAQTWHWRDNAGSGTKYIQGRQADYSSGANAPSVSITYSVPTVYSETGSGGVSLGGSAAALLAAALTATGGVALSGTAAAAQTISESGQGGVVLGGSASVSAVVTEIASGGVVLAGDALNVATFADVAQGGVVLGGEALAGLLFQEVGSGGVSLSGSADLVSFASYVASGGVSLAGEAPVGQAVTITAAGGVVLGGSAGVVSAAVEIGSGGVSLGGLALASVSLAELAAGGVIVGGEASVSVYSPSAGAGGSFICDACHVFRPGSQAWHLFAGGAVVVAQFVPGERAHQVGGCQCTT